MGYPSGMLKRIGAWGAIVAVLGTLYGAVALWGHHGAPSALPPAPTPALAATDGTGVGPAQDATGQAINLKLSVTPIPCGGTGVGPLQDSTMQCVLAAIGTGGGGVDAGSIMLAGDVTGAANANTVTAIRGQSVIAADAGNQMLVFNGTNWLPTAEQCPNGYTVATVNSGQTYAVLACDRVIRFIEDAGAGTAILPSSPAYGETHTLPWLAWSSASPTPPVINANAVDGGAVMVPFAGQSSSAPGGLTTTTTVNSPGSTGTWMWDGTEWVSL